MKKLILKILCVFIVVTVVVGFFVGDYLSRENTDMWERFEDKPSLVTAQDIEVDLTENQKSNLFTPEEDDKNIQVLRLESLTLKDKPITFSPETNIAGSVSLNVVNETLGRPKSVKPYSDECGVQDASIADFGSSQFKKIQAEYFIHKVTLANSDFSIKTPRLTLTKETTLDEFKKAYADKEGVLALDKPVVVNDEASSEAEVVNTPKKKNEKKKKDDVKTIRMVFSTSSSGTREWTVVFNAKNLLDSIEQNDGSCVPEVETEESSATN